MMGKYGIYEGERNIGELEITQCGGYLRFRACCRSKSRSVLRLIGQTPDGREVPLGVLVPNGSAWALDRKFSPAALREMGLSELTRCSITGDENWYAEANVWQLVEDAELQAQLRRCKTAMTRRTGNEILLALPLEIPFYPMSVFCFAEPQCIRGKTWLVFHILSGKLCLPAGHNKSGVPKESEKSS